MFLNFQNKLRKKKVYIGIVVAIIICIILIIVFHHQRGTSVVAAPQLGRSRAVAARPRRSCVVAETQLCRSRVTWCEDGSNTGNLKCEGFYFELTCYAWNSLYYCLLKENKCPSLIWRSQSFSVVPRGDYVYFQLFYFSFRKFLFFLCTCFLK